MFRISESARAEGNHCPQNSTSYCTWAARPGLQEGEKDRGRLVSLGVGGTLAQGRRLTSLIFFHFERDASHLTDLT